jgi:hypothetical protein
MNRLVPVYISIAVFLVNFVSGCTSSMQQQNLVGSVELCDDNRLAFRFYNENKNPVVAFTVSYALSNRDTGDFVGKTAALVSPEPIPPDCSADIVLPVSFSGQEQQPDSEAVWYVDFVHIRDIEYGTTCGGGE